MKKNVLKVLGWVILAIAALFFIMAGSQKLSGAEQMVVLFRDLGYPDWFRFVVGSIEVVGAVLLLIPTTSLYSAAALGVLMVGAVISELQLGHASEAALPGQWLLVFVLIVYFKVRNRHSATNQKA